MNILHSFSLEGKTALVVGGSGGIGKGIAEGLIDAGARVIVASRNYAMCKKIVNDIAQKTGAPIFAATLDITHVKKIQQAIDTIIKQTGQIHILVNCAGINIRKPALEYTAEDWDMVQNTQLKGVFFTCQRIAKHMIENKTHGKIINIASINAKTIARPHIVSYVAAKAAVVQLTKALAVEWSQYGIRINAIAPGWFETELTSVLFKDSKIKEEILHHIPMNRLGNAEVDIAGMVIYYASDASPYTTGQTIYIDGGYTII